MAGLPFHPQPKPAPTSRTKRTAKQYDELRDLVWIADESRSRASGRALTRGSDDPRRGGQVAHLKARGSHPERRFSLSNVCLLSIEEHAWSDARTANAGGRVLLERIGDNANRSLTFIRKDRRGRELWRYSSRRPRRLR